MNLKTYLLIKKASSDSSDSMDALRERYNAYTPSIPDNVANDDRFFGYAVRNKAEEAAAMDPKAMTYSIGTNGLVPVETYKAILPRVWHRSKYNINPAKNLASGKHISTPEGLMYKELRSKGYGSDDLKGIPTNILGLTGREGADLAINMDYYANRPSMDIWVDDAGNIENRSKGVIFGRNIGKAVGTVGGGYLGYRGGDWIANKLGLSGPKADKLKRLKGNALRIGTAIGGAYLGHNLAGKLGAGLGEIVVPQKGTKLKAYTDNAGVKMLENVSNI